MFAITLSAQIHILVITCSSDFTPTFPSEGSLASIGLTGLTGISGVVQARGFPLPYSLAGVTVTVSGSVAPMLAVADLGLYQQINIQMPPAITVQNRIVEVTQNGQSSRTMLSEGYEANNWSVFFADSDKRGVFQHTDYSFVTDANPAKPGEVLVGYATNLANYSQVPNAPPIGGAATANPLPAIAVAQTSGWRVLVNNHTAQLLYAGLTPGLAGVFQVNFVVPAEEASGPATLQIFTNASCSGSALCMIAESRAVWFPISR
jgi:uncharacterized protein (TIGR03437 family)